MFLSDRDILKEIERGYIICAPFDRRNVSNSSIDLRLGAIIGKQTDSSKPVKFKVNEHGKLTVIDSPEMITKDISKTPYVIEPGEFILAETLEYVGQDGDRIISELSDKSTLARLGLSTFFSAGYIDAGNALKVTLELKNNGNMPIELQAGMHICQLRFAYLSSPCLQTYQGKYLSSTGVEAAK